MIIYDLRPFIDNPAKRGIYGLLAYIPAYIPPVSGQGKRVERADSSGGGLDGRRRAAWELHSYAGLDAQVSLPYCDAQVYAVSPPGGNLTAETKEEATPLPLKDKAMAITRSCFNSTMLGLAVLLGHSNNVLNFHHPGAALRTFGGIKVHTHSSIFSRL